MRYNNKRNEYIDYAKGIGILLVVYGHVIVGLNSVKLNISETTILELQKNIIYSFHMPLFFFLSGIFVFKSLKTRNSFNFILNKIKVLIYPLFIWSVLHGGLQVIFSKYVNSNIKLIDLVKIVYLPLPDQHFWFLYSLFLMYITVLILQDYLLEFSKNILTTGLAYCLNKKTWTKKIIYLIKII